MQSKKSDLLKKLGFGVLQFNTSNGEIMDCDDMALSVFGYSPAEKEQQKINLYSAIVNSQHLIILKDLVTNKKVIKNFETEICIKDLKIIWVSITIHISEDLAEAIITDITNFRSLQEKKEIYTRKLEVSEKFLLEQTNILESILNDMAEGVIVAGTDGNYLFFNPSAKKILGLKKGKAMKELQLQSQTYSSDKSFLYTEEELPLTKAINGSSIDETELFITSDDLPEGIFIAVTARPLIDKNEKLKGGLIVFSDITERKKTEETLEKQRNALIRSNAELEQFAYVASHDLQEPLRMINSYMQLLEKRYREQLDQDARDFIDFAVDGSNRMKVLINDLLAYSRLNREVPLAVVDCNKVMKEVQTNLSIAIRESEADIKCPELPEVKGDYSQLVQVFQNLLSNSIKFRSEDKPYINIKYRKEQDSYIFYIIDNGIGIKPGYEKNIFRIFERLHPRSKYKGTGIGLAICKKIIEKYGGSISAQNNEDKGMTFCFSLPAA